MFIGDGWSFSSGGRSQVADLKETHEYSGSQYGNPISKKFRIVQVSERIFAGRYQGIQIKDLLVLAKVQEGVILKSRSWKNLSDVGYPGKASLVVDSPLF